MVERSRIKAQWILKIRPAYIQIATIYPQALRKELLASFLVGRSVAPQGIHYRLIGPGRGGGEFKFLGRSA